MTRADPDRMLRVGVCRNAVEIAVDVGRPHPLFRHLSPKRARELAEQLVQAAEAAERGGPPVVIE